MKMTRSLNPATKKGRKQASLSIQPAFGIHTRCFLLPLSKKPGTRIPHSRLVCGLEPAHRVQAEADDETCRHDAYHVHQLDENV